MAFLTLARWALGPLVPVGTWRLKLYRQLGKNSLRAYRERLGLTIEVVSTATGIWWERYAAMEDGTATLEQYDAFFWKAWECFDWYAEHQSAF